MRKEILFVYTLLSIFLISIGIMWLFHSVKVKNAIYVDSDTFESVTVTEIQRNRGSILINGVFLTCQGGGRTVLRSSRLLKVPNGELVSVFKLSRPFTIEISKERDTLYFYKNKQQKYFITPVCFDIGSTVIK